MTFNIKHYLKNAFTKGTTINNYNLKALVIVGSFGHPLFAVLHLYVFQMPWDSLVLKGLAGLICLSLATKDYWPKKIKPLFPFYWHFMLIYNLPFLITLTALNNHFIQTWFMWEIIMLYILIMFVPHWLIFLIDLIIGTVFALLVHGIIYGGNTFDPLVLSLDSGMQLFLYLSTFAFAVCSGLIFSYSNAQGVAHQTKAKIFKSLAGSIAHEIRNPLNVINLIGSQINDTLLKKESGENNGELKQNTKGELLDLTHGISDAIAGANNIINVILSDLSERSIDEEDFSYLNPAEILPEIIERYGYRNKDEKERVKLLLPKEKQNELLFKAVPDRFTFIMYNLLKNALYYLDEYPESIITVGNEFREIDGEEYNVIYVHDTGPGIPNHVVAKLFGDFYTSGKKDGTGLGLAFCKRNMRLFGGNIICESEFGKWTRFSLLFPIIPADEIEIIKLESQKKKILLVDDQEINLITTKSRIERILPNICCDIAINGKEALEMVKRKKYHLVLMDIEMPEPDGIKVAEKIRNYDKELPIIAFTSLDRLSFLNKVNEKSDKNDFNSYLSKSTASNILYRGLTKWIMESNDEFTYLGDKESYLEKLNNKKILLADDQQINRLMTKRNLEIHGLSITEAKDGKELLEIYNNSLNNKGKSSFDIILADIHMPPHDGDKAAKEIRNIEAINNISHHDEIPIIALSGDGDKEDIHHFFDCQMTDYFIKGGDPELLLKIIANYTSKNDTRAYNMDSAKNKLMEESLNPNIFNSFDQENKRKLLELFLKDSGEIISKAKENDRTENIKDLLLDIHSMKGIAINIGAMRLFYYIRETEPLIKQGQAPEGWFQDLEKIHQELNDEIRNLLNQLD